MDDFVGVVYLSPADFQAGKVTNAGSADSFCPANGETGEGSDVGKIHGSRRANGKIGENACSRCADPLCPSDPQVGKISLASGVVRSRAFHCLDQ